MIPRRNQAKEVRQPERLLDFLEGHDLPVLHVRAQLLGGLRIGVPRALDDDEVRHVLAGKVPD